MHLKPAGYLRLLFKKTAEWLGWPLTS